MFKIGTMLKAREVRLSRKKPPYHPALIPDTGFGRELRHSVLLPRGRRSPPRGALLSPRPGDLKRWNGLSVVRPSRF